MRMRLPTAKTLQAGMHPQVRTVPMMAVILVLFPRLPAQGVQFRHQTVPLALPPGIATTPCINELAGGIDDAVADKVNELTDRQGELQSELSMANEARNVAEESVARLQQVFSLGLLIGQFLRFRTQVLHSHSQLGIQVRQHGITKVILYPRLFQRIPEAGNFLLMRQVRFSGTGERP